MQAQYRDLLKHSSIYGVGQILSRLASFLLLPVYTRFLRPADYGCIAILDVTVAVLGIVIGAGMAMAVNRHHFETKTDRDRNAVWWTGLSFVGITATVVVLPAWLARNELAVSTLGPEYESGALYFTLVLATLWFSTIDQISQSYMRVRKWSGLLVSLSMAGLLFNIAVNVSLLVAGWGILGILSGNLLATGLFAVIRIIIVASSLGAFRVKKSVVRSLWLFGAPLVITGVLSLAMHQADRYFLRLFLDMHQVGIYSIAYTIGQGVNTIILASFASIWSVAIYEIAEQPNSRQVFARVFQFFVYGLMLVMLGLSLFAKPVISLMTASDYLASADLVPVICLAFVFFSLHAHFTVPALLAKKTMTLLPASFSAVVVNVSGNFLLIPYFGGVAAAWVSVATYATYSFVGLWRYRKIERFEYPFFKCAVVCAGMIATFVGSVMLQRMQVGGWVVYTLSAGAWLAWAGFVLIPLFQQIRGRTESKAAPVSSESCRSVDT